MSTTKTEYIAATEPSKEVLWMKNFLLELGLQQDRCTLYCDNQSAIHLVRNPIFHSRSKHIDVRYHWIHDALDQKRFQLEKIHNDDNGSDMVTRTLSTKKFNFCRQQAGMAMVPTIREGENC